MATTTTNQLLPYPVSTDTPADTPLFMQNLAQAVEKKLVQVFTSTTDRNTKLPTPVTGMFCITTDTLRAFWWNGASWIQVLPITVPAITSGGSVPLDANGANGDIYFKI